MARQGQGLGQLALTGRFPRPGRGIGLYWARTGALGRTEWEALAKGTKTRIEKLRIWLIGNTGVKGGWKRGTGFTRERAYAFPVFKGKSL